MLIAMRRFKWRLFRRKGASKKATRDEKLLQKNVEELKVEALTKGGDVGIKAIAKELLPDEE
ncbi:hypothetical protein Asulf_01827 [Archaeoglobus sulfaticallidus PM70-1]|uniref:Uncharacterized protein n=2 Tax=Archaeoglobus TaxID=2233 RepID=N0BFI7_9EURY|nr:hypothetical protein Asulf_01827 [Archaeoglobus sulfaticallidus PM70-1]